MGGVDVHLFQQFNGLGSEDVVADLGHKHGVATEFCGSNGLIGTLSTLIHHEVASQYGFARARHPVGAYHHVGVAAADHDDLFCVRIHGNFVKIFEVKVTSVRNLS